MGDATDITEILSRGKGVYTRSGWGKAIATAVMSALLSVVGTAWKTHADVAKLQTTIDEQGKTLKKLEAMKERLDGVENIAINARGDAQRVERELFAHLNLGLPIVK